MSLARQALNTALADAENDVHAVVERVLHFAAYVEVALLEDLPVLRVADDGPGDAYVLQHLRVRLPGVGARPEFRYVLCTDSHVRVLQLIYHHAGVDHRRRDDDVTLGLLYLQVLGKLAEGLDIVLFAGRFPVSSDEVASPPGHVKS